MSTLRCEYFVFVRLVGNDRRGSQLHRSCEMYEKNSLDLESIEVKDHLCVDVSAFLISAISTHCSLENKAMVVESLVAQFRVLLI